MLYFTPLQEQMTDTALVSLLETVTAKGSTTNAMLAQCERCAMRLLVSDSLLARLMCQQPRSGTRSEVSWQQLCSVPRLKQLYGIGLSILKELLQQQKHCHCGRWIAYLEQCDLQNYTVLEKPSAAARFRLAFTTTLGESYHCEIHQDSQTEQIFYTMVGARDD
jgi:hypothetical protein